MGLAARRAASMTHHPLGVGTKTSTSSTPARDGRGSAVVIGCYRWIMSVRKISVALEESTAKAAVDAATRHGVSLSSWLNQAAERALRVEEGLRAVQAWEAEHGALTDGELAAADRFLAKKQRKRAS